MDGFFENGSAILLLLFRFDPQSVSPGSSKVCERVVKQLDRLRARTNIGAGVAQPGGGGGRGGLRRACRPGSSTARAWSRAPGRRRRRPSRSARSLACLVFFLSLEKVHFFSPYFHFRLRHKSWNPCREKAWHTTKKCENAV